jgi:GLPGLI family protein
MKWKLTNDTMTLLNEKCLSAETFFRGRKYIAYYAPGFNSTDGPWKFGGLPGLILSVKAVDYNYEYQALKIVQNYSGAVGPLGVEKKKFIEWEEYVRRCKDMIGKSIKLARSNGTVSNETSIKLKLESLEIFYPELQTGEGIKF